MYMAILQNTFACLPVSAETSLADTLVGAGKVGAVSIFITGVRAVRALVDVWKMNTLQDGQLCVCSGWVERGLLRQSIMSEYDEGRLGGRRMYEWMFREDIE